LEATPAQRIEQMEMAKSRLLAQKNELQTKIDRLAMRRKLSEASSEAQSG
jgi:hypothetical protein